MSSRIKARSCPRTLQNRIPRVVRIAPNRAGTRHVAHAGRHRRKRGAGSEAFPQADFFAAAAALFLHGLTLRVRTSWSGPSRTGAAVDSNFFTAPEFESMNLASGSSTKGIPCVRYALF